ncbi:uncharacterized protein LOC121869522 isoform X2 [Homarus americanus]|uniref:uncharacterized protein LOC121869522 isoform X2 n=1 Tax=Homarus americanus TaxID=6706 RepID=UPI001C4877C3|nr:uncharacterized protein LOC121869522 isoform X2 [Homarus americanus]
MGLCRILASSSCARMSPAVQKLADDYFNWRLANKPEFASFVGIHDYDDQLDDMSLEAYQSRYDQCQVFFHQAEALEAIVTDHDDQVNIRALKNELITYMDGFPYQGFLVPLSYMEGVHVDLECLISWMVFKTSDDYEKLLSRYEKLPEQLKQIQMLMETGVTTGNVNHAISMKSVVEGLERFVVDVAEDSPLWMPFTTFPDNFNREQIADFKERANAIILDKISPGFQQLRDYVKNDYVTRPDIAVTSLPDGEAQYNQLIKFHTSISMTPQEIHQLGLKEVTRIEGEMAKIVSELGYTLSVSEFSDMIKNNSRFYYNNSDELMKGFEDLAYIVIPPKLPEFFRNIPKAELKIKCDPSPEGTIAYYTAGAYDGSRPGVFFVNTHNYQNQPTYGMMSLSLHEGNPGHHFQHSHIIESPNIPFFRRVLEDRKCCQAPSRFPMNTAYLEGWGLYVENLGFDMGLYEDLYVRYGHYSLEIFRASRLVVDTGLHALGWTRQEAVDYLINHTAMTTVKVENEVDRYITMPGQALAYKVGQLKLMDLRYKAASVIGDEFDIKKFHDVVLDSVGPLDLVEDEVNAWVNAGGKKLDVVRVIQCIKLWSC